jgi:hypothetical protein
VIVEEGHKCRSGILIGGRSRCKSGLVEKGVKSRRGGDVGG